MNEAEERQKLRPRAEARVHRVGIARLIVSQPLEEPRDRVVLLIHVARRHQAAVLGIEDEHQAHQRGEQPAVHLVRLFAQHLRQQHALRIVVRALESADEIPQRLQHLAGQLGGDLVLRLAAPAQERGQPMRLVLEIGDAAHVEQRDERAHHGAAERFGKMRELKRQVAGRLAVRRVDKAERCAVEEQADRDAGFAEQTFQTRVRAGAPAVVFVIRRRCFVEVGAGGND